ncbi:hypothetical protein ABLO27_16640 [Roseibium sp. SCPC15]|uniref:hypothetical protein n=1 Tax=Roseibium sp. SCP15 TaxID=3141376 RepID=UPI003337B30D
MSKQDYSKTISVAASLTAVHQALTAEIRDWWSEDLTIGGNQFTVGFGETKKTFKMIVQAASENGFEIVWICTSANLLHPDVTTPDEWVGTRIVWQIHPNNSGADITLTHEGLNSDLECHNICVGGWDHFFLSSLKDYIVSGKGQPFSSTKAA